MTHLRWRRGSIEDEDKVALLETDLPDRSNTNGWLEYYEVYYHSATDEEPGAELALLPDGAVRGRIPDGWYATYYHFDPVEGGRRLLVQAEVASALSTSNEAMAACEAHHARRLAYQVTAHADTPERDAA